jgi:hypothetical protein
MNLVQFDQFSHASLGQFAARNVSARADPFMHQLGRDPEQLSQQRIHILF